MVADGLDHAGFPSVSALSPDSELVISNQGSPMLMQASLLRGLFSAGENVAIQFEWRCICNERVNDCGHYPVGKRRRGIAGPYRTCGSGSGSRQPWGLGLCSCICQPPGRPNHRSSSGCRSGERSDMLWVAQSSNVMVSQTLSAVWAWVADKLPTYKAPIVEISTSVNLDMTEHNGRILVCSQPVTLTPLTTNMGSGFRCVVINGSLGTVSLGSGFVSSSGSLTSTPWQSATLCCATYSAGTIAFAAMPTGAPAGVIPGQVIDLSVSGVTTNTIANANSWQPPSSGGARDIICRAIPSLRRTTSWSFNDTRYCND